MNVLARRLRASLKPAALHLAISATIALIAMGLIYGLWYPGVLAEAQGVSRLVLILIGVDVVIGPLITLIVYAPGKKSLRLDLAVIATLQTVALLYGLQSIHGGRPAYVVFSIDRFDVVSYRDVDRDSLGRAASGMEMSAFGPKWVGAFLPEDPKERSDLLWSALEHGVDLQHLPEHYRPLDALRATMLEQLRPMGELRKLNELDEAAWQKLLAEFGRAEADLGYVPMAAKVQDGAAILDAKTGELLGLRLLTPNFRAPRKPEAPGGSSPPRPTAPAMSQGVG